MTCLVRLWKFDQSAYGEREVFLRFNPDLQVKAKPSFWGMVAEIYRNWRLR